MSRAADWVSTATGSARPASLEDCLRRGTKQRLNCASVRSGREPGPSWPLVSLTVVYAVGTSVLQAAYQRGDALTAAGPATMVTNAVPIAAETVILGHH